MSLYVCVYLTKYNLILSNNISTPKDFLLNIFPSTQSASYVIQIRVCVCK